jgi:hypothetical protein
MIVSKEKYSNLIERANKTDHNTKKLLNRIERLERIIVELAGNALKDSTTGKEYCVWSYLGGIGTKRYTTDGERLASDVKGKELAEVKLIKSWGEF